MSPRPGRLAAGLAIGLLLGGGLVAQEPQDPQEGPPAARDTAPPPPARDTAAPSGALAPEDRPRRAGCPLVLEPKDSTNLNRIQREGSFVLYIGGGMLWRCGNAEMEADSAVRYEAARRVEMMGNVDYRDTIRTLTSDFLTYYSLPDLVVAIGDVRLTRTATGSTLEGPRIEFLRAVSGREELTTATGRPHMTLYPTAEYEGEPFEVDAVVAELAGEEMARVRGDVVIRRPDLLARADSAVFDIAAGGGVLYGAPEVEGRSFRLSGDTIRLRFEEEELREVWARGRAFAAGESFEVASEQIRARIEEEKAREVWAHGGGRALAISESHRVYGDSLRFALSDGQIDTVVAVGDAAAEKAAAGGLEEEEMLGEPGGREVAGGEPEAEAPVETEAEPVEPEGEETRPQAGGPADAEAGADRATRFPPGDTAAVRRVGRARPQSIPEPSLGLGGDGSWMTGDTLVAIFEPEGAHPAAGSGSLPDTSGSVADSAESRAVEPSPPDSADAGPVGTPPDSVGRRLARIRVTSEAGTARAYYASVVDSSRTAEPSRNYIIGRTLWILFEDGEVVEVRGERAIGVYLDPDTGEEPAGPLEEPPDRTDQPSDSDRTEEPPPEGGEASGEEPPPSSAGAGPRRADRKPGIG